MRAVKKENKKGRINLDYGYKTDRGRVRDINEDKYLFVNDDYVLIAVADGMGGHNAGEIASTVAIDEIMKYNLKGSFLDNTQKKLEECISVANSKIYEYSSSTPGCHGMGTTITLGVITEDKLYVANVGDSRAYIINDKIEKVTVDHSYVEELKIMGRITEEEAKIHPNKNQITRAVGTESKVKIDIFSRKIEKGDIVLLCTDGLTNIVSDEEIKNIMYDSSNLQCAVDELVAMANNRGGNDNITVVAYKIDGGI